MSDSDFSPDSPSQREADLAIVRIEEKLDNIPNQVKAIITEGDYLLPNGITPGELLKRREDESEVMERVVTALDGPEVERLDGTVYRDHKQGIVHQTKLNGEQGYNNGLEIASINRTLSNGVKTKMDKGVKVAIIGAAGIMAASALPSLVNWLMSLGT